MASLKAGMMACTTAAQTDKMTAESKACKLVGESAELKDSLLVEKTVLKLVVSMVDPMVD